MQPSMHLSKSYLQSCGTRNLQKHRHTHTLSCTHWDSWAGSVGSIPWRGQWSERPAPAIRPTITQSNSKEQTIKAYLNLCELKNHHSADQILDIRYLKQTSKQNQTNVPGFMDPVILALAKAKAFYKKRKMYCIHWQSDGNINMENNEAQTRSCACYNLIKLTVLPTSDITCWCNFLSKQTGCWKARRWMNGWGEKKFSSQRSGLICYENNNPTTNGIHFSYKIRYTFRTMGGIAFPFSEKVQ